MLKHDSIEDYKNDLQELDHSTSLLVKRALVDLKYFQVVLFDVLQKNMSDLYALNVVQPPGDLMQADSDQFMYIC